MVRTVRTVLNLAANSENPRRYLCYQSPHQADDKADDAALGPAVRSAEYAPKISSADLADGKDGKITSLTNHRSQRWQRESMLENGGDCSEVRDSSA